jgi:hypothetical protein
MEKIKINLQEAIEKWWSKQDEEITFKICRDL